MTKICKYFEDFVRKGLTGERGSNVNLSITKNEKNSYKFYSYLKKPIKVCQNFKKLEQNL